MGHLAKMHVEALGKELGVREMKDWYRIGREEILCSSSGKNLLKRFHNSLFKMVSQVYPTHAWNPLKFRGVFVSSKRLTDPFWQRHFLDWTGEKLGLVSMESWYNVTRRDVEEQGGGFLLSQYSNSIVLLVTGVYKDHSWQVWRFSRVPEGYWESFRGEDVRPFVEWVGKELDVRRLEDWYRVSLEVIGRVVPATLFGVRGGLAAVLREAYPEHGWNWVEDAKRASQWRMFKVVERMFPNVGRCHRVPLTLGRCGGRVRASGTQVWLWEGHGL